jgi:hypothetical protein
LEFLNETLSRFKVKTAIKLDKTDPPNNKIIVTGVLPPKNNDLVDYEQKGCGLLSCFAIIILMIFIIIATVLVLN